MILEICEKRQDEWADTVLGRVQYAQDLHASDSVYHHQCSINFRTGKQIPCMHIDLDIESSRGKKRGRPSDIDREAVFLQVFKYLEENDDEQITINDLIEHIANLLKGTDISPYGCKHMKRRLLEHFGDKIIITEINGKLNVVTFKSTAKAILHDFYCNPKREDSESEKIRLIKTAAMLIKNDIKSVMTNHIYPSCEEIESIENGINYLPPTLKYFLQNMFMGKETGTKVASIGQAIMQSVRPRAIVAPLQIGLGVQMHRQFGLRFLIDSLNHHGFCSSYSEVQRYEQSAAVHQGTEIPGFVPGNFVQHVADNVDHNIRTLNGLNTFYGMGIIATITPGTRCYKLVPRVNVTSEDIVSVGKTSIHFHKSTFNGMSTLRYNKLPNFEMEDNTSNIDLLWKTSWLLNQFRPSWNGFMQMVQRGTYPGKSSVVFMPMIDIKSSDELSIYSTMCFVCDQSKKYGTTPILTFDQPLWWKALEIQRNEPTESNIKNIVLRLGGLHIEMSFLGSIGHLMGGSGLQEVLETIYADNAVGHILSVKAIARAVRGHILLEAVLNAMLMSECYNIPMPPKLVDGQRERGMDQYIVPNKHGDGCHVDGVDLCEVGGSVGHTNESLVENVHASDITTVVLTTDLHVAQDILNKLIAGELDLEASCSADVFTNIQHKLNSCKDSIASRKTAKLWLQYIDMVEILLQFIKAERTGNWSLHLYALSNMLPYFAAAGHHLYAKSAYLYLQSMTALRESHPDVYQFFKDGYHVIRRTDRYWSGLSTDLVIEQVLMRSVKTCGGLTRGRGMEELQRTVWLLSSPACAEVNQAMQSFTGVSYTSSEQHKESSEARQARDHHDMCTLAVFLEARNPFSDDTSLRNIASGVTADDSINVDIADAVGMAVITNMADKKVSEYSFKKKYQAVTLNSKFTVKIDEDVVQVDPQLLFQRIMSAAKCMLTADELSAMFTYELCTHPPALFDTDGLLREPNKPALMQAIWKTVSIESDQIHVPDRVQYVLDGGSLLHRIPWSCGLTYDQICVFYMNYVIKKYGKGTVVVFDGYSNVPSTKDTAHLRRTSGQLGKAVNFVSDMPVNIKKNVFLANTTNKQNFINMLGAKFQANDIIVRHAPADADVLIVTTAVEFAVNSPVVVVGEDTDLLVLLCYYADINTHRIYLKAETKHNVKSKINVWDVKHTKENLSVETCLNILFIHAILGCDTTSRVFGLGKGLSLKKYQDDGQFRTYVSTFDLPNAAKEDIIKSGENILVCLYGGHPGETLDSLRMSKFCQKVAMSTKRVGQENIPPTSAAAKYHSLRVYYQINVWKGRDDIFPEDWGWEVKNGKMLAMQTEKKPAPDHLLKIIRCKCKGDCRTACCTCKKHGLECSHMCSECRGVSCLNSPKLESLDIDVTQA